MKKIFILIFILLSFSFISHAMILPVVIVQPAITEEEGGGEEESQIILDELLAYEGSDPAYISSRLANEVLLVSDAVIYLESNTHADSLIVDALEEADVTADRAQEILYLTDIFKVIDFVTDGTGDQTYSVNASISGVNIYNDVTVDAAVVLTVTGQPGIIICNTINNDGSVDKSATGGVAGSTITGNGEGGIGGGGLIIIANTVDNNSTIQANGTDGEDGVDPGSEPNADGGAGGDGINNRIDTDIIGAGGDGGYYNTAASSGIAGGGGGSVWARNGGVGGGMTYNTYTANELFLEITNGLVDWWLENILSKTPTTTKSFINSYGAGGGGGGINWGDGAGGGGGGNGGNISVIAKNIDNTDGTIQTNGGNGGDGGSTQRWGDTGGGGGGGGIINLLYNTLVSGGTLISAGGTKGERGPEEPSVYDAEDGTAGTAKTYDIGE